MYVEIESWKDIPGYEGLYQASTLGNIKSFRFKDPKVLKGVPDKDGYYHVTLYNKEGKGKQAALHRFIAFTFLPNPENLPQINHKNEVKNDNRVSNLEWCSSSYNQSYSKSKNLKFISPDGEVFEVFNLTQFCKMHGLHKGCMTHVHNKHRSHHKGWKSA